MLSGCAMQAVSPGYYRQVQTSAPVEKQFTAPGSHQVAAVQIAAPDQKTGKLLVRYPSDMVSGRTYPLVIMANGTGVKASQYAAVFDHLASWGFIVAGNEDGESWDGASSLKTLQKMSEENARKGSIFQGKIDMQHTGIAGHSQGGVAVFNAVAAAPGKFAAAYAVSTTQKQLAQNLKWSYDASRMNVPVLLFAGTGKWDSEVIAPLSSLKENAAAVRKGVPAAFARRSGADHGDMLWQADGYMTAWFCWRLKGDRTAAAAFSGTSPEILKNSRWQDVQLRDMH